MLKQIPKIGLGTFQLEGEVAYKSSLMALESGYQHIDTAQIYGNEAEVGRAVLDSGVSRESIFLTTKVWLENLTRDKFLLSVKESLQKLKTNYVDLLLIHWPSFDVPLREYLGELKRAKDEGLATAIGVSNFPMDLIKRSMDILGANEIFTNQIEVHPFLQNEKLVAFCQEHAILVSAYMPLAKGKVLKDLVLQEIAQKYNTTPAMIALAWCFERQLIALSSSTKRENLVSNLLALELKLDSQDMERIHKLNRNERIVDPEFAPIWD